MKKYFYSYLLIFSSLLFAQNSSAPLTSTQPSTMGNLSSGLYASAQNKNFVKIIVTPDGQNITLVALSSKNQFLSDGYGIDEIGGSLTPPVTFQFDSPQNFLIAQDSCTAKLKQLSATSFKIKISSNKDCFAPNGMFNSTGYIDSSMLVDLTFTLDTLESNIQYLHGY
ncbi:MAG: hypothetical protein K2Y14_05085 [Burkholderiales bacterium]|nr:hypothetical protein [Burkholderiales bacterium]